MNKHLFIPLILFILGLVFLGYGIFIGEISFGLAVFIPFIISSGVFGFAGIGCLFLSILSLFFILPRLTWNQYQQDSSLEYEDKSFSEPTSSEKKTKIGGVIFLGPIPIVFGSNKKITKAMILVSIIILIIMLVFVMLHFY
ncbi:MAG: DUF131 domain-containing protein [Candidatus Thermoplasmatota archaeon]|nr:DUF131 domain-containing protein [Candidatus Thermoplasmatota archaeon]